MDYIEVKLKMSPYSSDLSDIIMSEMGDLGFESFDEQADGFNAYIPTNAYNKEVLNQMLSVYIGSTAISTEDTFIKAQNWNAVWESNFSPIVIGDRCVIRAPFHTDCPKLDLEVIIEPKMSFGTGHHDTTYLVSEWLLDNDVRGLRVLDMGCGTGILAIIAAMKNAQSVEAIDIDEWAYNNALENVKANGCAAKVHIQQGDASLLNGYTFDLILANINRNILLQDMTAYAAVLANNGTLVVSGIFTEDIPVIEEAAAKSGLRKTAEKSRNKWASATFKR